MPGESPLNPGAPARKRTSFNKFALWAGLILFGLLAARFIVGIGQSLFWFAQFSHSGIYQNQTLDEVKNRATVVRPLIDETQSFDIAVTVWSLPVEDGQTRENEGIAETPLYSDIVFRGLRLSDKHKQIVLPYKLPVAIFRRLLLKTNDLRAVFHHVKDFSTWRPDGLKTPSVRSWPFPLGALNVGSQSVADRALDSFGVSIPLLEFHEIQSKCPNENTESRLQHVDDDQEDEEDDGDVSEDEDPFGGFGVARSDVAKNPQHAVKRAPFVVTRTQLRVVDETHIFNRKAYNKEHNRLRSASCGQDMAATPDYNLCHRSYHTNGHWETRLELEIPDEDTGALPHGMGICPLHGPWPFLSRDRKILFGFPSLERNCTQLENSASNDPVFCNRIFPRPQRVEHNASEHKLAKAHDSAELWNGLYGHRFYEDAHPRRRFIINALVLVFSTWAYWYTRTSTVSISVSGTAFIALSGFISAWAHIANTVETDKLNPSTSQWAQWLWLIVWTLATKFYLPLLMLKTITPIELIQISDNWYPTVRRVSPTHKERASRRLDSRTGWTLQAGTCISLIIIYYLLSPDEYHVLSAHLPKPSSADYPTNIVSRLYGLVFFPLKFTGVVSQLLLNHRSKTFAGGYKIAVAVRFILLVLALIVYSPSIVGRFDARPGFSAPQVVDMISLTAMIYQASRFPKTTQKLEDEDSE
ncbi:hypothetical protein B0H11DRAFT_2018308 [Mycena galericulata]|nr:hypothetical protein B0H11DRAFT_2018308 [Mycena galericulata]